MSKDNPTPKDAKQMKKEKLMKQGILQKHEIVKQVRDIQYHISDGGETFRSQVTLPYVFPNPKDQ